MSVVEHKAWPLVELREYHRNPNTGGDEAGIRQSLRTNGQYRPVVVNKGTHTGRPMEVLAGNQTMKAARAEGWTELDISLGDWDDDQCRRIVLADNQLGDKHTYDDKLRLALLEELDDIAGTGFTEDEHAALANSVRDTGPGFGDAPVDDLGQMLLTVVIECRTEQEQQAALEHCLEQGYEATAVTR